MTPSKYYVFCVSLVLAGVAMTHGTPCAITCPGCSCSRPDPDDYDLTVSCVAWQQDRLPACLTTGVVGLELHGSRLTRLSKADFSATPRLRGLLITDSPALKTIEDDTFENLTSLVTINISSIGQVNFNGSLFKHQGDLKTLIASGSGLRAVSSESLSGLASLDRLDLSSNQLQALPAHLLTDPYFFHDLVLRNNSISRIDEKAFIDPPYANSFDLSYNRLAELPEGVFANKQVLRYINLAHNELSALPERLLTPVQELIALNLSYNLLTSVPSRCLQQVPYLMELDLSGNRLLTLTSEDFKGLEALEELHLNNLPLASLGAGSLAPLSSLTSLWLTGNRRLAALDPAAMPGRNLSRLASLYLNDNGLKRVQCDILKDKPSLNRSDISGNPLTCDCHLRWIQEAAERYSWARDWKKPPMSPSCGSPAHFKGQDVMTFDLCDLTCDPAVIENMTTFTVTNASHTDLHIKAVLGRGLPTSRWYLPGGVLVKPTRPQMPQSRVSATEVVDSAHRVHVALVVSMVTTKDSGVYVLEATNAAGSANITETKMVFSKEEFHNGLKVHNVIILSTGSAALAIIIILMVVLQSQKRSLCPAKDERLINEQGTSQPS